MESSFHPLVAGWFADRFKTPTEAQARGWPAIQAGRDTLIAAPTGSGKTLAAFLAGLDGLVRDAAQGTLPDETRLLYVSPLKALSNDIRRNLEEPLGELRQRALQAGSPLSDIRTAVRTGDTRSGERAAMLKRPPHVLVTTPESLYVLLTSEGGRRLLRTVRTTIVDEIHAVARDKRGSHLALSLERLDALCCAREEGAAASAPGAGGQACAPGAASVRARPLRIGLSATQKPISEIARFLVGASRVSGSGEPLCAIVDEGHRRALDLAIEVPRDEISAIASKEQRAEAYDRIAALVKEHRTTLVFTNTRRQAERVCAALGERLGESAVAAHHGSLARATRLRAEEQLKREELKAVVATASLELGIDVGHVELVVQLESPRSIAVALQRIGRSGHWRSGTPKGRLFPLTRDQLIECAALVRAIRAGELEVTRVPDHPLDVLAQQITAWAASEPEGLAEDDLFERVRRAYPYRALPRREFDQVIEVLSQGLARRAKDAGARLHRDGINKRVRGRRGARLAALTSGGAIPDTGQYAVIKEPEGLNVGSLDEDYAIETMAGDIFQLGNTSWKVRRVEQGKVRVEDAQGQPPNVPFWNGEAPGRTRELSRAVSALRKDVEEKLHDPPAAAQVFVDECSVPPAGAEQAVRYLAAAAQALGALPTQDTLVAERFFDEAGGMQLIVHAPFGARLNRAFGLALRKRFCRSFDFELQAAATDEGILLSLGPQHSFPLDSVFDFLAENTVEEMLTQAALRAPMWGVRFRWNAMRSLAVLRMSGGRKTPFNLLRMRTDDLMASVFPAQAQCQEHGTGTIEVPDHPLVAETLRDCLHEAMDLTGLQQLLGRIQRRELRLVARDTPEPSVLAHEILGGAPYSYLDDAPLEERRARAVSTRRSLNPEDVRGLGALDAAAIAAVREQAWPAPRDADELHEALLGFGVLPCAEADPAWAAHFEKLVAARRAAIVERPGGPAWIAAELLARSSDEAFATEVVRGWLSCVGPTTTADLARRIGFTEGEVAIALGQLEAEGVVLRGSYSPGAREPEWCERTLLSRIHRLTLGRLRREIEPVTTSDFLRFLLRWQHVHPGTQLHGAQGVAEVIAQLQGFQIAASAWESDILPSRVARYEPVLLDQLCLSGEVVWGRLCVEACAEDEPQRQRAGPTRATPLSLVRREDLPWLLQATAPLAPARNGPLLATRAGTAAGSPDARLLHGLLEQRGALFLHELKAALGAGGTRAEEALRELVALGLVTCDGFGAVRQVVSPARQHGARLAPGMGRWSLLRAGDEPLREIPVAFSEQPAWVEQQARQYLRRYGVVFRDLLAREPRCPPWRELLRVYRRLESRGELRGGRFAQAFPGEQFALPEALDALRTVRRTQAQGNERVLLAAVDPLNLAGILTPGPRVPAHAGNRLLFVDGAPEALQPEARTTA